MPNKRSERRSPEGQSLEGVSELTLLLGAALIALAATGILAFIAQIKWI